jgi:DNA-binding NarL/FixJ family response regulator
MQCNNCALSYEGAHLTNKRAMSRTCSGKKARLKMVDYFCYTVVNLNHKIISMSTSHIKIAILEEYESDAQLLEEYFNDSEDPTFEVVFKAYSGNSFFKQLEKAAVVPDMVTLKLKTMNKDTFSVLKKLQEYTKFPDLKVVVLTSYNDPRYLGKIVKLGAHALLSKDMHIKEFLKIIKEVYQKGTYFSAEQQRRLEQQEKPTSHVDLIATLTNRELDIIKLMVEGKSDEEIGQLLFISPTVIKMHLTNICNKLRIESARALLVAYARKNGLVASKNDD